MATAKEQLLSMMNPQQARLLDQQMRGQQVAQRSQGAGMLSGLVQAYTGMGDIAQRAGGLTPIGANERGALEKRALLEAQAKADQEKLDAESKVKQGINQAVSASVGETDLEKLATLRDSLLAMNKVEATAKAQAIQTRIDAIEKINKKEGKTTKTLNAGNQLIDESNLTEEQKKTAKSMYENGLLSPEELDNYIEDRQNKNRKTQRLVDAEEQIKSLGLPDNTTNALLAGLGVAENPTTILNKAISLSIEAGKSPKITSTDLSLYGQFTGESVDAFIKWKQEGSKGTPPRLVEPTKPTKPKDPIIATKVATEQLKEAVTVLADSDKAVKAFFTDKGWWDTFKPEKVKAFVSDILTYRRDKGVTVEQAIKDFVAGKTDIKNPAPNDMMDKIKEIESTDISGLGAEELTSFLETVYVEPLSAEERAKLKPVDRKLYLSKRQAMLKAEERLEELGALPDTPVVPDVLVPQPTPVNTQTNSAVPSGVPNPIGRSNQIDLKALQDAQRAQARKETEQLERMLSGL